MAIDPIHAFYCRKEWLQLAQACKINSGGYCARCGNVFDISELRPHHKIELTLDNIDDVNISLNPDNVEVLCHDCHNLQHNRFGHRISEKHVYIVYGSPFAGKTTYVETVATRNDVVVDLDKIHQAISDLIISNNAKNKNLEDIQKSSVGRAGGKPPLVSPIIAK